MYCTVWVTSTVVALHMRQLFPWENLTQTYYRQWDVFIISNRALLTISKGAGNLMFSTLVCLGAGSETFRFEDESMLGVKIESATILPFPYINIHRQEGKVVPPCLS